MSSERLVIFCLVPERLQAELLEPLGRHFIAEPRVRVIVDRRARARRGPTPAELPLPPRGDERRRGTDRRRPALPRWSLDLPTDLEAHRAAIRFVQRLLPVTSELESLEAAALMRRLRQGDPEAPSELYWRCSERLRSRLTVLLGDASSADAAVSGAFGRVLDAVEAAEEPLPDFEDLLHAAVDAAVPASPKDERPPGDEHVAATLDEPSLAISDPLLDEPVVVHDRDPRWFERARSERDALLRRAGEAVVAIEHIGGTAVPALPGRPIVDLLVGVEGLPVPDQLQTALINRGYENCGDAGTAGRAYYRRRGLGRFNVHVVEHGGPLWHGPLALREHLCDERPDGYRWAAARRDAARQAGWSLLRYAELRDPVLAEILARASEETPQRAG